MRGGAGGTPGSTAKGDVFGLVQYLNPGLNFGEVRKVLRPFIGLSLSYPVQEKRSAKNRPDVPFGVKWDRRRMPARGSPTWRYLTETRQLSSPVVLTAIRAGVLREGPYASGWFAHRDQDGWLTGIEMRGPDYRGFSPGGDKTLFRLPGRLPSSAVPVRRPRLSVGGRRVGGGHRSRPRGRALPRATGGDGAGCRGAGGALVAAARPGLEQRASRQAGEGGMTPARAWVRLGSGRWLDLIDP
jgi:Protein of unknown function (DUF3991)